MRYDVPPLLMDEDKLVDAVGEISVTELPDFTPRNATQLKSATPMIDRLWRIALHDAEANIIRTDTDAYFGAGTEFGPLVYTRDISYAGILGLNRLYPDLMLRSLEFTRRLRLDLGLRVPAIYKPDDIEADWEVLDIEPQDFLKQFRTNCYMRRTDDVVWLWCIGDLADQAGSEIDWEWVYRTGAMCFERLYDPFFDPVDGLFRGQATFVDIHFPHAKATGYPQEWSILDCVRAKATSTNCLYVKGMRVLAAAAENSGRSNEAVSWRRRADDLVDAIRRELRRADGTYTYLKDKTGVLAPRSHVLGSALVVLLGIESGDDAVRAVGSYPLTDAGAPLFDPFYPENNFYHNNSSWPFADTFLIKALEQADGQDRTALNAALLARTCRWDGTFHEVVDFRDKEVRGSGSQLWSAAAFIDTCRRAGLLS